MTFDQSVQLAIAVGTSFAALATSSAVIYSLIQTRRATRSDLRITMALTLVDGAPDMFGDPTAKVSALKIQIANLGQRTTYLTTVGWKTGQPFARSKKKQNMTGGWPVPCKIEPAEYATFFIAPDPWEKWLKSFSVDLLEKPIFGSKPYLRLLVFTSLGEEFTARIPKEVFAELSRFYTRS